MSGFDLPPTIGRDLQRSRLPLSPELQGPLPGIDGKTIAPPGIDGGNAFESALQDSIGAMRGMQEEVDKKYTGLVLGENVELHDVMIAASKSEVMFNLMIEVRNKLVDAWEKLSRSAG